MRITKKVATAGVAGALTVACVALLAAPVSAAAPEDGTVTTRAQAVVEALSGLIEDGTLTQEQADAVATTLDESDALRGGHGRGGGRHMDLAAAATALGMAQDELRTALEVDDTSLADVAAAQDVEVSALVEALVAAQTERLAQEVADGDLTQAEADERVAALPERVAALVEEETGPGGRGHGPRGGERPDGATADEPATDGTAS